MRTCPLTVAQVGLGPSDRDHDTRVRFLDRTFRLVRVGTDGDVRTARELAVEWAGPADALAVDEALADHLPPHPDVTVTTGRSLADVLQEWAVRHVHQQMPGFFANARTVVLGGDNHARVTRVLREFTDNIEFSDPLLRLGVPDLLASSAVLGLAADVGTMPLRGLPRPLRRRLDGPGTHLAHALARRAAREADVVVATYEELEGLHLEDLAGKTLVTSAIDPGQLADLAARGVDMVLDDTPQPFGVTVTAATLEAMMLALVDGRELTNDDLLDMVDAAGLEPRVLHPNGPRRRSRFAFVIHPLSTKNFTNVEPLATVARLSPAPVVGALEKVLAYAPPFTYSHVTGITSPTGAEAEGWLITVGGTPKELMAHDPEFTYSRLLAAADIARRLGAQVMGLGAFTKVVGDAGVTVAKKAPLPITTGNSYSASGALWAAHEAVARLGLVERDEDGRLRGKAMVVGATGAIGSVCAKLLALASDELWLVSPETAKLLALKEEIGRVDPRASVHVAATPDEHLREMDVIVTATSGAGKRVLDIMAVKPGAVITDVARPLDLSAEDVAKRPDVLVVESGEIELPGEVHMRDIGLPPGVVYACMAETVVLALEGRYETFTVGRQIEWEKVKEIYRLGLKHGMRLAAISGVNGVFTDADLDRVRALALTRRNAARVPAPRRSARSASRRRSAAGSPRSAARRAPAPPATQR